jgi:hypothetical protein
LYSSITIHVIFKGQWHHYQSTFDEAFTHGNTDPDCK